MLSPCLLQGMRAILFVVGDDQHKISCQLGWQFAFLTSFGGSHMPSELHHRMRRFLVALAVFAAC